MSTLTTHLHELVQSLPPRPIPKEAFDSAVSAVLARSEARSSPENRKLSWEIVLKDDIFKLAVRSYSLMFFVKRAYTCQVVNRRTCTERPLVNLLRRPPRPPRHHPHLHGTRRLRTDLSLKRPLRPLRNPNHRILFTHLRLDRIAREPSHGRRSPSEG